MLEDVGGGGCWGDVGQGRVLRQDVACAAEQRTTGVTSVTPGRKGLSTSRQGLHGLRYANWRLAGAERGSAELRGTLAQSHGSLLPPLKLPPFASPLALFPTSLLQLSAPHASHRQAW